MESTRFPRANSLKTASPDDAEADRFNSTGDRDGKRPASVTADYNRPQRMAGRQPDEPKAGYSGRVVNLYGNSQSYMEPKDKSPAGSAFPKLGAIEGPAWQDYFFLAPNVRFTRTPDYEAKKHGPQQDHDAVEQVESRAPSTQQAIERPVADAASSSAQKSRNASVEANRPPAGNRAVMHDRPPQLAAASVPPVRPSQMARALPAPATVATARPSVRTPAVRGAGAPTEAVSSEKLRWPYLSDHAFFEVMAPYLVDAPSPVRRADPAPRAGVAAPLAAAPVAAARIDIRPVPATDVTASFRVIECLPGQASSALPDVLPANSNEVTQAEVPVSKAPRRTAQAAANPATASATVPARVVPSADVAVPVSAARPASLLPLAGKIVPSTMGDAYQLPSEELLQQPPEGQGFYMSQERLEQNADLLESVLEDFGVRGEIIHVRPGPVVTLYEFEPAPGVKSSRVIGLADDIARSMSAVSARVAVVPGRNVIGIELPNETRETVYFRELIESEGFRKTSCKLALCLGKTIGGEPVIAELAKMPHLLVAGTTGSGKSVAINTMILSLLYRLKPEECRLIMVDPKMLELSIYDGIPHLLTPVVTDPKKAVTALKWAVREMEDRYRKMARLGVRNIDGYNERAAAAREKGETVVMTVQTGFEKGTGEPLFEQQEIDLAPMPFIVIIVDEMADLMMVAGKEIEGAIQRLAQMARAAGIHLIMATQRPSVDVITGTIKANFPTRISFQVTSKIDSRTILGEQGAEQLLGQGDMLHMVGGGRIARVHGPFVSDVEVEHVVAHLKAQGRPEYLETVTADEDEEDDEADQGAVFDKGAVAAEDSDSIYDEAVKVVLRDKKCSTSYIQRRLGVGYNRAASLVERMEKEGLVGAPNHVGKREIMMGRRPPANGPDDDGSD
ncbi:DNA translocase FtsK [Mesorhizobium shangrilense]|uniref:DNA translocase FtsK n=1 Tax=Mesorhizobium shangrilense TaxID=460060 RepID=A0ABV2DN92_9HYPH